MFVEQKKWYLKLIVGRRRRFIPLQSTQLPVAAKYTNCIPAEINDPHPNECSEYDAKPFDGGALFLEPRTMWSTPLPLLPGPLKPGVVVSFKTPSTGQIELIKHLTVCQVMDVVKLNCLC